MLLGSASNYIPEQPETNIESRQRFPIPQNGCFLQHLGKADCLAIIRLGPGFRGLDEMNGVWPTHPFRMVVLMGK